MAGLALPHDRLALGHLDVLGMPGELSQLLLGQVREQGACFSASTFVS
jgi:hypothetical protein